jgi:hypothetical protein
MGLLNAPAGWSVSFMIHRRSLNHVKIPLKLSLSTYTSTARVWPLAPRICVGVRKLDMISADRVDARLMRDGCWIDA